MKSGVMVMRLGNDHLMENVSGQSLILSAGVQSFLDNRVKIFKTQV